MVSKVVVALLLVLGLLASIGQPLGRSAKKATHVKPVQEDSGFNWRRLFALPNTYYERPRHRYPYYDSKGHGRFVYGYGGKELYKYTIFKPLEGYFKR